MQDPIEDFVSLETVSQFLYLNGYAYPSKPPRKRQSVERFTKLGAPPVNVQSYRGLVTLSEFERIKAFVAPRRPAR